MYLWNTCLALLLVEQTNRKAAAQLCTAACDGEETPGFPALETDWAPALGQEEPPGHRAAGGGQLQHLLTSTGPMLMR